MEEKFIDTIFKKKKKKEKKKRENIEGKGEIAR